MASSTGKGGRGCWSRSSASEEKEPLAKKIWGDAVTVWCCVFGHGVEGRFQTFFLTSVLDPVSSIYKTKVSKCPYEYRVEEQEDCDE